MSKVKIADPMESEPMDSTPPMPRSDGRTGDQDSSFQSTSLGEGDREVVPEELAADLIGLPYEFWAAMSPEDLREAILLSEKQKAFFAGPASRVMTKYGLGKIAKDEIILVSGLGLHTFMAFRAVAKYKRDTKVEGPPAE